MTILETILIIYIWLSWFIIIMFVILPKRIMNKVFLLFIIVCPPLIIGFIGELIKKMKEQKKELEHD